MSYVSLLKNIPDILSQPAGIAAIASVGIHGAIAFILPLMPVDSSKSTKEASSNKPVGLVQLSQADQNRLREIKTQIKQSMEQTHNTILAILTPEQRQQVEQKKLEMEKRREEFRQKRQERKADQNSTKSNNK